MPFGDRRVVEEVAGLEGVGPVDDHVVAADDPVDVVGDEHLLVGHDGHVRIQRLDRLARRFDLALADPVVRVEDLALEVREVDNVEVDDPDRADAGRREVERGRAAETAGADQQRLRLEEAGLAGRADFGDQQVAAVALLLLAAEDDRGLPRQPGRLPGLEPAGHRGDIRVAELLEGLGGEQRTDAARAVEDHLGITVRGGVLDLLLDVALADVDGAGQVALVPLGGLADVDTTAGASGPRASTSCGVTSRIWERASLRRSA